MHVVHDTSYDIPIVSSLKDINNELTFLEGPVLDQTRIVR
jgi:hypothetical protein